MSPLIVEAFKVFGEPVTHITEVYPDGDPGDETWIRYVGKHGLFVVSLDKKIALNTQKLKLLQDNGIGAFFFTQRRKIKGWDWVELVVKRWRQIKTYTEQHQRPFSIGIPERGVLEKLGRFPRQK